MSDPANAPLGETISFGPFRLTPAQQLLAASDKPVHVGSRALEILICLVERAGEVVSKDELVARVWPNTFVEDANLRVHMAALRKALGDGESGTRFIITIPGRGYSFVAPIERLASRAATTPPRSEPGAPHNLPAQLVRMIGREETVAVLVEQLPRHRFVTILGPGGIGKTTVALAASHQLTGSYPDGIRFVDLAPISDPQFVPDAVALALGLPVHAEDVLPSITGFLRTKGLLFVLDSCEHVIDAAATLAEQVLKSSPGLHILATSREPLRAEGEHVHRLPPLAVPPSSEGISAEEALRFPAVRLFVDRATASADTFVLNDADAPLVADICRRLDGIALAIELTAGRTDAFGLRGLSSLLSDRFRLLTTGRRTALPRHQTLGAALDWSYGLLPDDERTVLRRLAVLAGDFSLEAASAVGSGLDIAAPDALDAVANLVAKSLITADISREIVRYRLLDTTRAYALEKLIAGGEYDACARRHAEFFRDLFERAETEIETRSKSEWLALYGWRIDNVRAALDWAFSPEGDPAIGIALTAAAVPLWTLHSLTVECRQRLEQALGAAGTRPDVDPRSEMRLRAALGWCLDPTKGPGSETVATWTRALEIAESLDNIDYQLRVLWGLWVSNLDSGYQQNVLRLAQRFADLAARTGDHATIAVGDRINGVSLHYGGDQTGARMHIDRMLLHYVKPANASYIVRFHHDQRVMSRATLARILWLQGLPDRAAKEVQDVIQEARSLEHAPALWHVLGEAALFVGELAAAEFCVTTLLESSSRQGLARWHAFGRCLEAELRLKRGDVEAGIPVLRGALDTVLSGGSTRHYTAFLGTLADGMGRVGRVAEGLAAIDEALLLSEQREQRWCLPELQRIKGELIVLEGAGNASSAAEGCFLQALDLARLQGALAWELRAATSLARLRHRDNRSAEARAALEPVYSRFTEGFATPDLQEAHKLLGQLLVRKPRGA